MVINTFMRMDVVWSQKVRISQSRRQCRSAAVGGYKLLSPNNSANHSFQDIFLESHSYHVISKYDLIGSPDFW